MKTIDKETQFQKHIRIFMEDNNLQDGDFFNMTYKNGIQSAYNPMQVKSDEGIFSSQIGDSNLFFTDALNSKIEKVMSHKEYIKAQAIELAENRLKEAKEQLELALKM
jgi:hypothetical protein